MRKNKGSSFHDRFWPFTTYFAEGFPYSIIRSVSAVFFRDMKVSLEAIGLTPLYGLPWVLKFLWAPQVDSTATKRKWIFLTELLLVGLFFFSSFAALLPGSVKIIALLFFVGAALSATHDIAIDGYYMERLETSQQALHVGTRTMAYRIAMMTGTGLIVTVGAFFGWPAAFGLATLLFGIVSLYHLLSLKECSSDKGSLGALFKSRPLWSVILLSAAAVWGFRHLPFKLPLSPAQGITLLLLLFLLLAALLRKPLSRRFLREGSSYSKAFLTYVDRPGAMVFLLFIVLLRPGEFMMSTMVSPFLIDLGFKVHYGWISGFIGLPLSILGALAGGWLISRYGLRKTLTPFLLLQNGSNLVYMLLARTLVPLLQANTGLTTPLLQASPLQLAAVASVHGFDQFSSGLGTAALMVYLMRLCLPSYKATHYAIGSGLMSAGGLVAGVLSGFIAQRWGYATLFGISFLASLPAMALIPFLPYLSDVENEKKG